MAIAGSQVAKDSADLILLDDNFSSILSAVREGRRIYDNAPKYIRQGLTANTAEVSAVMFAFLPMSGDPTPPLTALMILWINLVNDAIPALALGMDEAEPDLMSRKPRPRSESFFSDHLGIRILIRGLFIGWLAYFTFDWALDRGFDVAYAQTEAFFMIVSAQVFHIFDARTFSSVYRRNPFENHHVLAAVAGSAILSLAMIYTPSATRCSARGRWSSSRSSWSLPFPYRLRSFSPASRGSAGCAGYSAAKGLPKATVERDGLRFRRRRRICRRDSEDRGMP